MQRCGEAEQPISAQSSVSFCPRSVVALVGLDNSELPLKVDLALWLRHFQTLVRDGASVHDSKLQKTSLHP